MTICHTNGPMTASSHSVFTAASTVGVISFTLEMGKRRLRKARGNWSVYTPSHPWSLAQAQVSHLLTTGLSRCVMTPTGCPIQEKQQMNTLVRWLLPPGE